MTDGDGLIIAVHCYRVEDSTANDTSGPFVTIQLDSYALALIGWEHPAGPRRRLSITKSYGSASSRLRGASNGNVVTR